MDRKRISTQNLFYNRKREEMRKPTCSICQGKKKDNLFIYTEGQLVHKSCKDLQKNITIHLNTLEIGVQGRM